MNSFDIKLATNKDLADMLKLSLFLDPVATNQKGKIEKAIRDNYVWVAVSEGQVVGYGLVELFDDKHDQLPNSIFLSALYVLESYRRRGIGKMLVQKVLEVEYPEQYKYFSLSHDPKERYLTDFYQSFGFEVAGKTNGGNIKMIKNITYEC